MEAALSFFDEIESRVLLSLSIIATGACLAVLWLVTYFLWRSSQKQYRTLAVTAHESARAAKEMADHIAVIERAYVHPLVIKDSIAQSVKAAIEQREHSAQWPSVQFKFKNYGKTAALLTDIKVTLVCWTGPPIPTHDFEQLFPTEAALLPGQETEVFLSLGAHPAVSNRS